MSLSRLPTASPVLNPDRAPAERPPETPSDTERELDVCRKLRTKLAFTPLIGGDGEPLLWQRGDGSTAVYWCLRTMECAGPDGGLCHATLCRSERGCYAEPG